MCQIASAKPHRAAMTKNTTGSDGFGLHSKRVIIKPRLRAAATTDIANRPTYLTIAPHAIDATASTVGKFMRCKNKKLKLINLI